MPPAPACHRGRSTSSSVNLANPGFKALFTGAGIPEHVAGPTRELHQAVVGKIEEVLIARSPGTPTARLHTVAVVATQIFGALLGTVVSAQPADRDRWVTELKHALLGYLGFTGAE